MGSLACGCGTDEEVDTFKEISDTAQADTGTDDSAFDTDHQPLDEHGGESLPRLHNWSRNGHGHSSVGNCRYARRPILATHDLSGDLLQVRRCMVWNSGAVPITMPTLALLVLCDAIHTVTTSRKNKKSKAGVRIRLSLAEVNE